MSADIQAALRHILALLDRERQAFATLDIDLMAACVDDKVSSCDLLEGAQANELNEETLELLHAARRQNEINRRMRNILASNVQERLQRITGRDHSYSVGSSPQPMTAA
ncbi:hypothetical protein [Sphingomicrobium astaxanthinifaciens]|uniref:hypothetical protein n=1 Tax=Sphingomicrobium astaxanthinifaciens TaxID=1227949 RepID=UPI001FCB9076|nr:hypothetical protein [Sphingomicrobium astaxanthinifaciens]MCJ7420387.1 hypothetical protein [Sphingomicrobium astaxanthinifaciens]